MNQLETNERAQILDCLAEGNSMRATARLTGVSINTVVKLLIEAGNACSRYQDQVFRNLKSKLIQCDEVWAFVGCKEKSATAEQKEKGRGDVWTWAAIDSDTKLIPCWYIGTRDGGAAYHFIHHLASRLASGVQLTTDGRKAYLNAVDAFGSEIDFAMLANIYGSAPEGGEVRNSPAQCIGAKKTTISDKPDCDHVSTSFVERQNLAMRMGLRRFTLTNGFSKKVENHEHSVALHFLHYNFCRIHKTLRVTPAMKAGITDHVWEISEIVDLIDENSN